MWQHYSLVTDGKVICLKHTRYWKCNFPMNLHVRLVVSCSSVGLLVGSQKGREVDLYASCFLGALVFLGVTE